MTADPIPDSGTGDASLRKGEDVAIEHRQSVGDDPRGEGSSPVSIRTRVEVPHNDAPGRHEWWPGYLLPEVASGWARWSCRAHGCPGRLLVREADIEQLVNDAMKETT